MTMVEKIKKILVEDLNLEGLAPGDIDENALLFVSGPATETESAIRVITSPEEIRPIACLIRAGVASRPAEQEVDPRFD
jgi:hypothetical protein